MRLSVVVGFTLVLYGCGLPVHSRDSIECNSEEATLASAQSFTNAPLPERDGPRIQTTGSVPHESEWLEVVRWLYGLPVNLKR